MKGGSGLSLQLFVATSVRPLALPEAIQCHGPSTVGVRHASPFLNWTICALGGSALILLLGATLFVASLSASATVLNSTPLARFGMLMAERITAYLLLLLIPDRRGGAGR